MDIWFTFLTLQKITNGQGYSLDFRLALLQYIVVERNYIRNTQIYFNTSQKRDLIYAQNWTLTGGGSILEAV